LRVQPRAIPPAAAELDREQTIPRAGADLAARVPYGEGPVVRADVDEAVDVPNIERTVARFEPHVRLPGHVDDESSVPALAPVGGRTDRPDFDTGVPDPDLLGDDARPGLRVRAGLDPHVDLDVVAIPAPDRNTAIAAGVHRDRCARRRGPLDLYGAVPDAIGPVHPVLAAGEPVRVPLLRGGGPGQDH